LHPLTPLLRGAKVLGALTAIGLYRTYQTIEEFGWVGPIVGVVTLAVLAVGMSWMSWRFTGYRVTGRELHIHRGILARRHRTVPLERVQAIDVVRPVLARLCGLAELRLEVVGGDDTEATLAYLSVDDATELRERLLAEVSGEAPLPETPAAERPLFAVDPGQLVVSQLLTPYTLALPLLMIWPVVTLATDGISIASLYGAVTGVIGVAQVPLRRVLREFRFAVSETGQGLRIRSGMVEIRTQTVAPGRVQAVRIRRPLLWRPLGWVRVEIDVAGYSTVGHRDDAQHRGALVPVADARTAEALVRQVLAAYPPEGLDAVPLVPVPRAARWLAPLRYRRMAAGLTPELFVCRTGWLTDQHHLLVHARTQSLRYRQGPLQRRLGVATVHADLAGGHGSATAEHLAVPAARALVDALAEQGTAARAVS
jgi:putative membrane protein